MGKKFVRRGAMLAAAFLAMQAIVAHATAATAASPGMFGVRETVEQVDLSPDGKHVVYVTPGKGRNSYAMVAELGSNAAPRTVLHSSGDPERISWCRFAGNTRLVCKIGWVTEQDGLLIPFTRLLTLGIDGSAPASLGQKQSTYDARLRQFDGAILDWLPGEDGMVLMARNYVPEAGNIGTNIVRNADGLGIDRIDLHTLRTKRIEQADARADFFITDGRGEVRIKGYQTSDNGQLTGRWIHHFRMPGSREWRPFSIWNRESEGMWPLDVDTASNSAYVLRKLDGRLALYRVKLDNTLATELVYSNPRVDVDGVVRAGHGSGVIGVTYAEEKRHVAYFDSSYQALATSLGQALPDLPMIDFVAADADAGKLLIHAGSDADPGRYYVFDRNRRKLDEILLARPALEHAPLAAVRPVAYPARDGTRVPGYLTLPPGKQDARGLPGIVLPHGGPSARDEWGFDWLAQFLAHRGYAVLQPNYRGSAGFGDDWQQENGFRGWRTSVGDINDGGRWLRDQGVAPDRLAILGWSYGGYAALQSGSIEPGLFKAIVAIAPVTDLALLKRDASGYTSQQLVASMVGSGAHVVEGSPLRNAGRIEAPVLLFHGTRDLNVSVQHSHRMDRELRAAGKSSELVVFEGLEHSLADSEARTRMLERIDAFLGAHTGS
ncbi:alpha/beta hydrolase family protein [Pseudoxanthomonas koreensis]|uniref:alpha/beta hydrolase family protein n=1 Tax=Pseudoxanthomonas koreensis TaxID=266061 RepID=UPI001390BD37|nr:S9 family peptidase [Pseudoxanthomonas koreensis]